MDQVQFVCVLNIVVHDLLWAKIYTMCEFNKKKAFPDKFPSIFIIMEGE